MSSTGTTPVLTNQNVEDVLVWVTPLVVALAGFNWSGLIPGDNNGFFTALAFGFLAKLLVGLQQNGWKHWEDLLPTVIIILSFLSTSLSANPQYLFYGTVFGFIVKALGYFQDKSHPIEDAILAVGAFLSLYGVFSGNATMTNAGALLALVGKSIPSIGSPSTPPAPAPAPSS